MAEPFHPNLAVLQQLDLHNLKACGSLFADHFTWHYFNSELPELNGDYHGLEGLQDFFAKLGHLSKGSFRQRLADVRPVGDELVITQVCNQMTLDDASFEVDAVVVWRIVNDQIAEAWDIPAVNTVRPVPAN